MVYDDPVGPYLGKLLGRQQAVIDFANWSGFKVLPDHIDECIAAFMFYETIHRLSAKFSPSIFQSYKGLSRRNQINFDIHVVSMVQCILVILISYPLFKDPILSQDYFNAYTPYAGFISAMAIGYFAWDTYVCTRYVNLFGPGFLVHGICALLVYGQSLRPYALYYSPIFLLFELSTPFLNVHWFSTHLPAGTVPEFIQIINGVFLLLSFFSVRIVWGFYFAIHFGYNIYLTHNESIQPLWVPISMLVSNLSLDFLNVYWFSKMIYIVKKRIAGPPLTKKTQ